MKITHLVQDLAPYSTATPAATAALELLVAQANAGDEVVVVAAAPGTSFQAPPSLARRLTPLTVDSDQGPCDVVVMEGLVQGCHAKLYLLGLPEGVPRAAIFGRAALQLLGTLPQRPALVHLHDDTGSDLDGLREGLDGATVVQSVYDADRDDASLVDAIRDADAVVAPCSQLWEATPDKAVAMAMAALPRVPVALSGLDLKRWNPATDATLAATFSPEALSGKAACRAALQERAGLAPRPEPLLLAVWPRYFAEADTLALVELWDDLLRLDVQLVALPPEGGQGTDPLQAAMRERSFGWVAPDAREATLRAVLGGADAVLLPDQVAPLGQRALIAMRYGLVPVARRIQAHRNLLVEYDAASTSGGAFLYENGDELFRSLHRLVQVRTDEVAWGAMVRSNALVESDWSRPLAHWKEIYRKALAK